MEQHSIFGYLIKKSRPKSFQEIIDSANDLRDRTIGSLAKEYGWTVPKDLKSNRGWVGNLVEFHLGGEQNSDKIDFSEFNLELKTISLNHNNYPKANTSLCQINQTAYSSWYNSDVYKKLQNILFVIVQGDDNVKLKDRLFGPSLVWTPNQEEMDIIYQDWQEIMELITLGHHHLVKSNLGKILMVSVKALNSKSRNLAYDSDGELILNQPLSFYIRKEYIAHLITSRFS